MKAIGLNNRILFFLISLFGIIRHSKIKKESKKTGELKKGGVFYYYPKYNIYYSVDNSKWYIKKGYGWIAMKVLPKGFSLFFVILSDTRIINCTGSTPFCYDKLKFQARKIILKPEILKKKSKARQFYFRQKRARFRYLSLKDCNYKFSK